MPVTTVPPSETTRRAPPAPHRIASIWLVTVWLVAAAATGAVRGQVPPSLQELHIIGTGSVVGLYYPVGGAVSLIVNNTEPTLLLTVKVTPGSIANTEGLERGEVSLALIQSDVLHQAYFGDAAFDGAPRLDLRALVGLHPEPLHLVCRRDAEVARLRDIEGKRVNLGNVGSGVLNTVRAVLSAYRIDEDDDLEGSYLEADQLPAALAAGDIDCFFFTVGIGGAAIQAAAALTDVTLVPLDDPELERLRSLEPYYAFVTVPAGTYRGVDQDVTVFGVRALLVTTDAMREDTAYRIVRALLESFEALQATYPAALEPLRFEELRDGLSTPLHEGAKRAYEEMGL